MTEAHIKEKISLSYVTALAAHAGMSVATSSLDYGFDGTFRDITYDEREKRYGESGYSIDFQLKSTVNVSLNNGFVEYNLEVKNYNQLIKTNVGSPRILIVYSMPSDSLSWITVSRNETVFRKCAWWCSLKGFPEINNKKTVKIKIPEMQQLSSDTLRELMNKTKEGAEL